MNFYLKLSLLIPLFSSLCSGQILPAARQISLCHSDVAISDDIFAIFNNPGGLAQIRERESGFFYSPAPFGLEELSTNAIAHLESTEAGGFGIGIMKYGFDLLNEYKFVLSYAGSPAKNFFLGFSAFLNRIAIKNYGNSAVLSFALGGIFCLNQNVSIGFAIFNPFRASYGNTENQIPVSINTGFSYKLKQFLSMNLSLFQETGFSPSIRTGIEVFPAKFLIIRAGFNDYPETINGGIGLLYSFFRLDYALSAHLILGITHHFSILLNLNRN